VPFVYKHIRLDNQQPFYVGLGKAIERAYTHYGRSDEWCEIVRNFGYKVQIIARVESYNHAKLIEKERISYYGRLDKSTGILVNKSDGGEGEYEEIEIIHQHKDNEEVEFRSYFAASLKTGIKEKLIRQMCEGELKQKNIYDGHTFRLKEPPEPSPNFHTSESISLAIRRMGGLCEGTYYSSEITLEQILQTENELKKESHSLLKGLADILKNK
jgi:hypothetical protein